MLMLSIAATGTMTYQAMVAAAHLQTQGIQAEVLHVPTVKPLDAATILASVRKTGAIVTAEEGQINGGLGGAIAELLAEQAPTPLRRIGVRDRFGESGEPNELLEHFGLTAKHIEAACHELLDERRRREG